VARQMYVRTQTIDDGLRDGCTKGGGPICTLALEMGTCSLNPIIDENVTDPHYRGAVVRARGDGNGRGLRRAGSLGLVHLNRVLLASRAGAAVARLRVIQRACAGVRGRARARYSALRAFIRTHDLRFHDAGVGAEGTSRLRASALAPGQRGGIRGSR